MSRRRQHSLSFTMAAGDPGKDLFAYLFLLIMVFAFMLLMSQEQLDGKQRQDSAQKAPEQKKKGSSQVLQVAKDNIAVLEEKGERIFLRYGRLLYDPEKDFQKLLADKRIVTHHEKGAPNRQMLYIAKKNQETISLFEYLETFQKLSQKNVSVAFAQELL